MEGSWGGEGMGGEASARSGEWDCGRRSGGEAQGQGRAGLYSGVAVFQCLGRCPSVFYH